MIVTLLGKSIRIYGQNVKVIGVTKKKGQSMGLGDSDDDPLTCELFKKAFLEIMVKKLFTW